jgi:hypothetical protein
MGDLASNRFDQAISMFRSKPHGRVILVLGLCTIGISRCVAAQDSPVLRERLSQLIVEELSKHSSRETAYHSKKSKPREKWTSGKVFGKPIRLASWTEESETWFWFDDPVSTLSVELKQLNVVDGRIEFALAIQGRAQFKLHGRIPKLAKAAVGGSTRLSFELEGSALVGPGKLEKSEITRLTGRLDDLQFNNDAAGAFENLVKDSLNDYVVNRNDKVRRTVERAMNRVKF